MAFRLQFTRKFLGCEIEWSGLHFSGLHLVSTCCSVSSIIQTSAHVLYIHSTQVFKYEIHKYRILAFI